MTVSRQIIIPSWYHELFWTFETVLHQWIFHLIFIISSSLCIYYEQLWEIKSVSVDCDSSREQRTVNIFKMGHGRVSSPITLLFSKCHVHFVWILNPPAPDGVAVSPTLSPLIQTLQPRKRCLNCLSTNKSTPATTMSTSKLTDLPLFPLHLFFFLSISWACSLAVSKHEVDLRL